MRFIISALLALAISGCATFKTNHEEETVKTPLGFKKVVLDDSATARNKVTVSETAPGAPFGMDPVGTGMNGYMFGPQVPLMSAADMDRLRRPVGVAIPEPVYATPVGAPPGPTSVTTDPRITALARNYVMAQLEVERLKAAARKAKAKRRAPEPVVIDDSVDDEESSTFEPEEDSE